MCKEKNHVKANDMAAYNQYVRDAGWAASDEDLLVELECFEKTYLYNYILKTLSIEKNTVILEIGGGKALPANLLNKYSDNVYVVDHNEDEICGIGAARKISTITRRTLTTTKGDFEKIPYANGYFDVIIAKNCLHHSTNIMGSFIEINRVLKKQGSIVLIEPCKGKLISEQYAFRNFYKKPAVDKQNMNEHALAVREWVYYLNYNNFIITDMRPTYFFFFKNNFRKFGSLLQGFLNMLFWILEKIYLIYSEKLGQPILLPHPFTLGIFGFEYFEVLIVAIKEN